LLNNPGPPRKLERQWLRYLPLRQLRLLLLKCVRISGYIAKMCQSYIFNVDTPFQIYFGKWLV
jgi:hypothetical protein